MKVAYVSPNGSISKKPYSHRSHWVKMRENQMDHDEFELQPKLENLTDFDLVFIYSGMEFKGSLNLFGGLEKNKQIKYLEKIENERIPFVFLDNKPGTLDRKNQNDSSWKIIHAYEKRSGKELTWMKKEVQNNIEERVTTQPQDSKRLVIGDSHASSQYLPGSTVWRNDYHTLFGTMKKGFQNFMHGMKPEQLVLYFGNIDIRHHICRLYDEDQCELEAVALAKNYVQQAMVLANENSIDKLELIELLPIEHEERKLPKTGYHEGRPFWGSRELRAKAAIAFNTTIKEHAIKNNFGVYSWHNSIFEDLDKHYLDASCMEKPKSVHLSWEYSRFANQYPEEFKKYK